MIRGGRRIRSIGDATDARRRIELGGRRTSEPSSWSRRRDRWEQAAGDEYFLGAAVGTGGVDFFLIYFSDLYPGDPGFDDLPSEMVCLHCLLEDGDEQLGQGLDLAKIHGQVDWDEEVGEWFVPDDHWQKGEL